MNSQAVQQLSDSLLSAWTESVLHYIKTARLCSAGFCCHKGLEPSQPEETNRTEHCTTSIYALHIVGLICTCRHVHR